MVAANTSESFGFHTFREDTQPAFENSLRFREGTENYFSAANYVEEQSSRGQVVQINELFSLFQSAKLFTNVDQDQLKSALLEAIKLKASGLFPDYMEPQIAIDECGEFMFTYKNAIGYIDIGLSGEGEISFHARNDKDPQNTVYGDVEWDGLSLPLELIKSTAAILNS